jgi:AcrR family transcriptional regulator
VASPTDPKEAHDNEPQGNARGRQRREELLQVTCDYLLSEGLQDFSVRQIAKRAGATHRIVLYHFGSTANLLREALRAIRAPILQRAATAAADPLAFAADVLNDESPASNVLVQSVLQAGLDPNQYRDIGRDYVDAYLPIITDNLPTTIDPQTRSDLAALILCAYRGAILDARSTGEPERGQRALALLADLLQTRYGQLNRTASSNPARGPKPPVASASIPARARPSATGVRTDVDEEGEHYEEPLESGHVVARPPVPKGGVGKRRPRQQEEAEERNHPTVKRAAEDTAEDPQQEQHEPWGDQRE